MGLTAVSRIIYCCMRLPNFCIDNACNSIQIVSAFETECKKREFMKWWSEAGAPRGGNLQQGPRKDLEYEEPRGTAIKGLEQKGITRPPTT